MTIANGEGWTWIDLGSRLDLLTARYLYTPSKPRDKENLYCDIQYEIRDELNDRIGNRRWICLVEGIDDLRYNVKFGLESSHDAMWVKLRFGTAK